MNPDQQIGKNLARIRGSMSQKELAEQMRLRDFRWSQATVWSIEKGDRPLRFSEAEAIVDILNVDLYELGEDDISVVIHAALKKMTLADQGLDEALERYEQARLRLSLTKDWVLDRYGIEFGDSYGPEFVDGNGINHWIEQTPEQKLALMAGEILIEVETEAQRAEFYASLDEKMGEPSTEPVDVDWLEAERNTARMEERLLADQLEAVERERRSKGADGEPQAES